MRAAASVVALVPVLMLVSCATVDSAKAPDTDLRRLRTFYVVRLPADERGVEKLISARLVAMGYQSTYGDAPTPPQPVDAVVTYQDRWMWDVTMYMIKLDLQLRDGKSGAILARSQVQRPSLQRKSPEGMVDEALGAMFK